MLQEDLLVDDSKARRQLLTQIEARRADIEAFLSRTRPRRNRLGSVSVASSAMAALFTAGPAIGGQGFTKAVGAGLDITPVRVWQPLCLIAFIVSLVAAVTTNILKSSDLVSQVSGAETCKVELECLSTSLQFRQISVNEAVDLYQQYVLKIPFVHESAAPASLPRVP